MQVLLSMRRITGIGLVIFLGLLNSLNTITAQININALKMETRQHNYGIAGAQAPELRVSNWIDEKGDKTNALQLKDYEGKFKVIYCFQSWCPGCHSRGLPALQQMVEGLKGNDKVVFMAVQTVFEGKQANTFEKIKEVQKQYELDIPFGHDEGDNSTRNISSIMHDYRTGGTPWFILIDQNNQVVFNDYFLNTEKAIEYLQGIN